MAPIVGRIARYGLISIGGITLMSAVVNIIGAVQLIDALSEENLGFTRHDVIRWYIGPLLAGIAMILIGIFWRRKR